MKTLKNILFVLIVTLWAFACQYKKTSSQTADNAVEVIDSITKQAVNRQDTIKNEDYSVVVQIDTPSVVFFMPDYREQQKAYRFYGYYSKFELEQIFRNFRRLYMVARPTLLKDSINTFLTYHWRFRIRTDSGYADFDRKAQEELLGFILTDTHRQPQIYYGVYRFKDFQNLIRNYFNLPDFVIKDKYTPVQLSRVEGNP